MARTFHMVSCDIGPGVAGYQIPLQAGVTNVVVTAWSKHRLTSQVYNLAITRAEPLQPPTPS